jgi:hypothetical protein
MAGETKFLEFSEGVNVSAPSQNLITASGLVKFADTAAFVAAKGSIATEGDVFYDTTLKAIRFYNGSAWCTVIDNTTAGVLHCDPVGTVDGSNDTFDLPATPASADCVIPILDGETVLKSDGSSDGFILTTHGGSPAIQFIRRIPQTGEKLKAIIFGSGTSGGGGGGGGGGSETTQWARHIITSGEATAKQFVITPAPSDTLAVVGFIPNAVPQLPPTDFEIISGNIFSWAGKNLDGILSVGDTIVLNYNSA